MTDRWLEKYGPWAVVTGASSGIGRALARKLAGRGVSVAAVARRQDRLEELAAELRVAGVQARAIVADLVSDAGIAAVVEQSADLDVGLFVANAGFGMKGRFVELDLERQIDMVRVNCIATTRLTYHFAKRLARRGRGGMIITSSTAAFQGTPNTSVYAATKGFDLLLAEGLHGELAPQGIDVLGVCPGPTDTEGPRRTGVNPDKVPNMMSAEEVAADALEALGQGSFVVPGVLNRIGAALTRLVPRATAARIAGKMVERATSR